VPGRVLAVVSGLGGYDLLPERVEAFAVKLVKFRNHRLNPEQIVWIEDNDGKQIDGFAHWVEAIIHMSNGDVIGATLEQVANFLNQQGLE